MTFQDENCPPCLYKSSSWKICSLNFHIFKFVLFIITKLSSFCIRIVGLQYPVHCISTEYCIASTLATLSLHQTFMFCLVFQYVWWTFNHRPALHLRLTPSKTKQLETSYVPATRSCHLPGEPREHTNC